MDQDSKLVDAMISELDEMRDLLGDVYQSGERLMEEQYAHASNLLHLLDRAAWELRGKLGG
jgi:hypothetical protein